MILLKIRSSYFYCLGKSEQLIFGCVERLLKNRSFLHYTVENSLLFFQKIPIIFQKRTSSCKKMSLFEKSCHLIFWKNKMMFLWLFVVLCCRRVSQWRIFRRKIRHCDENCGSLSAAVGFCQKPTARKTFPRKYLPWNDMIFMNCEKSAEKIFTNECFYSGENWLKKLQCEKYNKVNFHIRNFRGNENN